MFSCQFVYLRTFIIYTVYYSCTILLLSYKTASVNISGNKLTDADILDMRFCIIFVVLCSNAARISFLYAAEDYIIYLIKSCFDL